MRNATLRFAQNRCRAFGEADMEVLAKENYEEYLCFCREKNAHFMQTPQWAGVKAGWKSDICCCGKFLERAIFFSMCQGGRFAKNKICSS